MGAYEVLFRTRQWLAVGPANRKIMKLLAYGSRLIHSKDNSLLALFSERRGEGGFLEEPETKCWNLNYLTSISNLLDTKRADLFNSM